MTNDINIPKSPAKIEGNHVFCPTCSFVFEKALRCPECGQLISYDTAEQNTDYDVLAEKFGIKQAPTLVVINGENVEKYIGVSDIKKYLKV